ncbi:MAG: S8 family serine peptidase [Pseudomonadota bacterium]
MGTRLFGAITIAWLSLLSGAALAGGTDADRLEILRKVAVAACQAGLEEDNAVSEALPGTVESVRDRGTINGRLRRQIDLRLSASRMVRVQVDGFRGRLRRVRVEMSEPAGTALEQGRALPRALVDLDNACAVRHGRSIAYDATGRPDVLRHFDHTLSAIGPAEELNPAVPAGDDPGGVTVGLIDSGVNYLLPEIGKRLARRADGSLMGYDYWDEDDRPFDLDTGRSPFFPIRHGTTVASVFLREAPRARLVPYRYPRPDMRRMGTLVETAAKDEVFIVMMPLGSRTESQWEEFASAARRHPDMLFVVSAGNDGRDIDRQPLYPAGFGLENVLVVTSSDAFGRLAEGSNWGRDTVHIMAPGERIDVTDHRGAAGKASGSSFAVPRVAALAARLAAQHPDWRAAELMAAIRGRTARSLERSGPKTRWGWIPNPVDDG